MTTLDIHNQETKQNKVCNISKWYKNCWITQTLAIQFRNRTHNQAINCWFLTRKMTHNNMVQINIWQFSGVIRWQKTVLGLAFNFLLGKATISCLILGFLLSSDSHHSPPFSLYHCWWRQWRGSTGTANRKGWSCRHIFCRIGFVFHQIGSRWSFYCIIRLYLKLDRWKIKLVLKKNVTTLFDLSCWCFFLFNLSCQCFIVW